MFQRGEPPVTASTARSTGRTFELEAPHVGEAVALGPNVGPWRMGVTSRNSRAKDILHPQCLTEESWQEHVGSTDGRGFTLIELWVVIAIMAILDRPAAARRPEGGEAAAMQCSNNSSSSASPCTARSRRCRLICPYLLSRTSPARMKLGWAFDLALHRAGEPYNKYNLNIAFYTSPNLHFKFFTPASSPLRLRPTTAPAAGPNAMQHGRPEYYRALRQLRGQLWVRSPCSCTPSPSCRHWGVRHGQSHRPRPGNTGRVSTRWLRPKSPTASPTPLLMSEVLFSANDTDNDDTRRSLNDDQGANMFMVAPNPQQHRERCAELLRKHNPNLPCTSIEAVAARSNHTGGVNTPPGRRLRPVRHQRHSPHHSGRPSAP